MKLSERLEAAREALDSMDDFARMEVSIDPVGPRKVLEDFIEAAAELARSVEDADIAKGSMDSMPDNYRMLIIHMANGAIANPYRGKFFRLVPHAPTPPDPGHER